MKAKRQSKKKLQFCSPRGYQGSGPNGTLDRGDYEFLYSEQPRAGARIKSEQARRINAH